MDGRLEETGGGSTWVSGSRATLPEHLGGDGSDMAKSAAWKRLHGPHRETDNRLLHSCDGQLLAASVDSAHGHIKFKVK